MGGRYCAINSPRGSRWGQKSRDRRSRDFCPHRGPSRELIAQYRPSMSFCFYPTLYLGNHLYFLKHDSSWKHSSQRETASTQLNVSLWWRHDIYLWRHNGARRHARAKHYEFSCRKIAPKPLVYIDPIILLNYYISIPGKTIYDNEKKTMKIILMSWITQVQWQQ